MKLSLAAAAIAFSGTALILTPATASAAQQDMKPQATAKADWSGGGSGKAGWTGSDVGKAGNSSKGGDSSAKVADYDGMAGLETSSMKGETGETGAKLASETDGKFGMADMDMGAKFQNASDAGSKGSVGDGDNGGKLHMAGMDTGAKVHGDMTGKNDSGDHMASAKTASAHDSSQPVDTAAVSKEATAPGAAIGEGKTAHTGMGGPEEGTSEYPPCRPGPGDDRCIQLYEVGGSAKA